LTVAPSVLSARTPSGRREQVATRAVFLVAGLAIASWAPLVPFAQNRLDVDEATLGLLLLCLGVGSILAMPVTGMLAARFGCRMVLIASGVVLVLVLPMLALADSIATLGLSLGIFGASVGTVDVAMNIQAVIVEKHGGRRMMSGFHGLFSLGGIVGAGMVSLLLGMGLTPSTCTLVVGAMLTILLVTAYGGLLTYGSEDAGAAPLFVLPRGFIIFIGLLCFLTFLVEGAILDWSALFLIAVHDVQARNAGYAYTIFAVAMTAGRLTGDLVVRKLGGTNVIAAGGVLCSAGFAVAVLASSQPLAFAGFLLIGLGASNIVPVLFTAAGRQTRMPSGLAISAITTLGYAGILAGPALIGLLADVWGLGVAFLVLAGAMLFVGASGRLADR
jgi:MFS family permease